MTKIVSLKVENYQRIKAVEIRPDGNVVRITGANGEGKSSILDAMWSAIGGPKHTSAMPIRKGASEAMIEVDLGELKATKIIRKLDDGELLTTLIVRENGGIRASNPQEVLKKLTGLLTFDPLAFSRAKDADRLQILRGFVEGYDFDAAKAAHDRAFAKRTEVNRDVKRLTGSIESIVIPAAVDAQLVDESALVEKLRAAEQNNASIMLAANRRDALLEKIEAARNGAIFKRKKAEELRAQIRDLEAAAELQEKEANIYVASLAELVVPEAIDTAAITAFIDEARQHNAAVQDALRMRQRKAEAQSELDTLLATAAELTAEIAKIKSERDAAVASAKIPVPGISFDDTSVLLDGVPFDQASTAQKIEASVAIASALNPKLRVIQVRDGSLLDSAAKKIIADFAEKNDMQFWIEEVDESGEVGFVIEDGMVKAAPAAQAAE